MAIETVVATIVFMALVALAIMGAGILIIAVGDVIQDGFKEKKDTKTEFIRILKGELANGPAIHIEAVIIYNKMKSYTKRKFI